MENGIGTSQQENYCHVISSLFNLEIKKYSGLCINKLKSIRKMWENAIEDQSIIITPIKNGNPDEGFAIMHCTFVNESGEGMPAEITIYDRSDAAFLIGLQEELSPSISDI